MRAAWRSGRGNVVSYLDEGAGPTVLFLHALGRSATDWDGVIASLEGFRCVAPDLPGHGESDAIERYSFEALVEDVRGLVTFLGLADYTLVGHSMGGTVALLLAQQQSSGLARLVIEDTALPRAPKPPPEVPAAPPHAVDYDWRARQQLLGQLSRPDPGWWNGLARVRVPTMMVCGRDGDHQLAETVAQLPEGSSTLLAVGHWIHEAEPDAFAGIVRRFAADASPDGRARAVGDPQPEG